MITLSLLETQRTHFDLPEKGGFIAISTTEEATSKINSCKSNPNRCLTEADLREEVFR